MKITLLRFFIIINFLFLKNVAFSQTLNWVKNISAGNSSTELSITSSSRDIDGNIYNIGTITGAADFNASASTTSLSSAINGKDLFIQKLDVYGNFIWAKKIGGASAQILGSKIKSYDNSLYIIGTFDSIVDFNPSTSVANNIVNKGPVDAFVLKLDTSGVFDWVKTFGSPTSIMECNAINISNTNEILIGGSFNDLVDFDPNNAIQYLSTNSTNDPYLLKLSFSGNFLWAKSFPTNGYGSIHSIETYNGSTIYTSGNYIGMIDLNPSAISNSFTSKNNSTDIFMSKYTVSGAFIAGKSIGGNNEDFLAEMKINSNHEVILAGNFEGTSDFNPGNQTNNLTSSGIEDAFISKLNNYGDYLNAQKIGSSNNDLGSTIFIDNNYSIVSSGNFKNTVDFDPTTTTSNLTANNSINGDVYTFNWDQCSPDIINYYGTGCSYTLNGQTYTSNGMYNQVYTNSLGCDSILYVNISASSSNTTLNISSCSNSYTFNGQTYTTSGTYTQNYTNISGCDSNYIINLSLSTPTSSTLNASACSFYFWANQLYFSSGTYVKIFSNAAGCDSTATLNLTIFQTTSNTVYDTSCGPIFYNGFTYSSSGTYSNLFSTVNGCDSAVNLILTIIPIPNTIIIDTACYSYTFNGQNYVSSGNYTQELFSVNGCDSTIDLKLTIYNLNTGIAQNNNYLSSNQIMPATYQWFNCSPFTLINGANSRDYVATENGTYGVIINANGCTDTSYCVSVTLNNLTNINKDEYLTIFPNPASSLLNVTINKNSSYQKIKIVSLLGAEIFSQNLNGQKNLSIPINHISNGIYILEFYDDTNKYSYKFIKE